jgi:hypothetical protein
MEDNMKKFLFLYMGGMETKSPEDGKKIMEAWMAWFGRVGDKVVDGGAPLGSRKTVGTGTTGVTGYSLINADSLEAAIKLTDNHPHIMSGGSIEVCETVPVNM